MSLVLHKSIKQVQETANRFQFLIALSHHFIILRPKKILLPLFDGWG
jgi:hypothetical protein